MSFAQIAGTDIASGRVTFRLAGAWDAEITCVTSEPSEVSGAVRITVGGVTLQGFAVIAGADSGNLVRVRVVGGANGLGLAIAPQGYVQPTRRQVVEAILASGGEALSRDSDASLLDAQLPQWTRTGPKVADALWRLVEHAGGTWRVLGDGSVWVGVDTWPEAELGDAVVDSEDPANRLRVFALESLDILPGMAIAGEHVAQVVYRLDEVRLRAEVTMGDGRGDLEAVLGAVVAEEVAHLDYLGTYLAKVVGQNADGTLELRPYDTRWPGLSQVPARVGLPGVVSFQVVVGGDALFTHENGDPTRPHVVAFAQGAALKVSIEAPDIRLGSDNASDRVTLDSKVLAQLGQIINLFNAHTHPVAGSATGAPVAPMPSATSMGAAKVAAE